MASTSAFIIVTLPARVAGPVAPGLAIDCSPTGMPASSARRAPTIWSWVQPKGEADETTTMMSSPAAWAMRMPHFSLSSMTPTDVTFSLLRIAVAYSHSRFVSSGLSAT